MTEWERCLGAWLGDLDVGAEMEVRDPDGTVAFLAPLARHYRRDDEDDTVGTVVQLRAPAALRGRVLSLYMVALGTVYPIGAVIQGALGDRFGLRTVTAACAGLFLVLVLVARATRPDLAQSLDDPA